jgi:hypothetical protein
MDFHSWDLGVATPTLNRFEEVHPVASEFPSAAVSIGKGAGADRQANVTPTPGSWSRSARFSVAALIANHLKILTFKAIGLHRFWRRIPRHVPTCGQRR